MFYFIKCGIFVLNIEFDKNAADLIYFIRSYYCSVSVLLHCNSCIIYELSPTIIFEVSGYGAHWYLSAPSHHFQLFGVLTLILH